MQYKTAKLQGPFSKETTTNSFTADFYAAPLQTTFYYSVILEMIDALTRYYVHSIKSKLRKGREIDRVHSRGQHLCKFIRTKESAFIRKEFNSHIISLGHPYGCRDFMWKHSIFRFHSRGLASMQISWNKESFWTRKEFNPHIGVFRYTMVAFLLTHRNPDFAIQNFFRSVKD